MPILLIIGGADTGRAPMATALLNRMLAERGLPSCAESAGVVGHDGDPAEPEARSAMTHFGLDISQHRARSVDTALLQAATALVTVDSGTARVLRAQFPDFAGRVQSLGDLANRQRDVPDPFRMQIGAWIAYGRELEALLTAALPRLLPLLGMEVTQAVPQTPAPVAVAVESANENQALERMLRILHFASEIPEVIDWSVVRAELETLIDAETLHDPLAPAYSALLTAALSLTPPTPNRQHAAALAEALQRLTRALSPEDITWLSRRVSSWRELAA